MQALARLCEVFPDHEKRPKWEYALSLYADYIRQGYEYTAPYYVAPASIYHEDEAEHRDEYDMGMIVQFMKNDDIIADYKTQVRSGIPLGKGYYLRRMPVAYAHRGNHALTLCGGKAAASIARLKNDYQLGELAQRQLEWIVGKNPFAESVMFGEGYDYCQEYAVLPGEMVGELGVGFACLGDHDAPFWPQVNTCVYKEVWIKPPLHWAWLAADIAGEANVRGSLRGDAGDITFTHHLTGSVYRFTPHSESGWFEGRVPAGEYTAAYNGRSDPSAQ